MGKTTRRLEERLSEHFQDIREQLPQHALGEHFKYGGHQGISDVKEVHILKTVNKEDDDRLAKDEGKWIKKMQAKSCGINRQFP